MFSFSLKRGAYLSKRLAGACFLTVLSVGAAAAEYRLFVNDAAACKSAGVTGDVCLVGVGSSVTTSSTSTTTTIQATQTTGTANGCVVTVWNKCGNSTTSNTPVNSTPVNSTPVTSTSTTTVSSTASAPSGGTVAGGNLDFGSGGGNATGSTYGVTVTNDITAYPFTVKPGAYFGLTGIVPTSAAFPDDGTGVRMWWSNTAGGAPLSGACQSTLGRTGSLYWDQSGTLGYGCQIPNVSATLYLNFQACISAKADRTCSYGDAKAGSGAPVYISGQSQLR